jgi:hypothetical protein
MSFELDEIIPWGRTAREYELMFDLAEVGAVSSILGCGDGPAGFNAEMTSRGFSVISCDPIYVFSPAQIRRRFEASVEPVMSQVRARPGDYVWTHHRDPDDLLRNRQAAIGAFLADFGAEDAGKRYMAGELPNLPFADNSFDLAVCSHLLFLYSKLLSLDFHLRSVFELCRVAREARIFPLTGLNGEPSPHLVPLERELRERGLRVEIVKVHYQLQPNGDQMMRIWR